MPSDITVEMRFHADELGVHVIGARLGERRKRVGRDAGPTGDAHVDALGKRFGAEIFSPLPTGDVGFGRVVEWQDAHVAVAAQHQRPEVARVEMIQAHQFDHGVGELVDGVLEFDTIDLGGVVQAAEMFAHAKDGRAGGRRVTPHAFKDRAAVAGDVSEDVDLGILPGDESTVVPDLFRGLQHTIIIAL